MATPELLQLLDSVLAGEIPEIPVFEQRVGRISAIIRSMDPKEVKAVQTLIQQGTQEGKYDRGNSELVLMYLQSAMRGSSASLRLHTKKSRRRREEGETGNAPAQVDASLRLIETEPDLTLTVPDETKDFLKPFWSGKSPRRSVHHSVSPKSKSRDFTALRTLTSELERLRGKALGQAFRRLLSYQWAIRELEVAAMRLRKEKIEGCKRLLNHLRKASISPKSQAIGRWRARPVDTPSVKPDQYIVLKRLFTISKSSFFLRKQRVFVQWKSLAKSTAPILSPSPVKRSTPRSWKRKRAAKSAQQTLSVSSADMKEGPGVSGAALDLWKRLTMGRWKDSKAPGHALASALLRRADKTLKMALNRVMVVNRLSTIQQFGYALARLDLFIAPTDIALKAAYLTWNRCVPRVRKERIRATLRLALRVYKRMLRLRISVWKAYIQAQTVHRTDLKVYGLIAVLSKVLQVRTQHVLFTPSAGAETDRTNRPGSRLYYEKTDLNKRALRTLCRVFAGRLKETLQLWSVGCVTLRRGKDAGKVAAFSTLLAGKGKLKLTAGFQAIRYKADSVSAKLQAEKKENAQKPLLKAVLQTANNQLKATFSEFKAIQQLYALRKTAIGRSLLRSSELKTLKALRLWQSHCLSFQLHSQVSQTQEELGKGRVLQKRLLLIWRRQLRLVIGRVVRSDKDRLGLGGKMVLVVFQRRQKGALGALQEAYLRTLRPDHRFSKLRNSLERAGLRTLRPSFSRLISSNAALKAVLRSLAKTFGRTAQSALQLWKHSAQAVSTAETASARTFQALLHRVAIKTLRKGLTCLQADNQRAKSALRALALTIERSQESAWKQWKLALSVKAGEGLQQQIKGGKLNHTLERIARKPLRSGLPRTSVPASKAEANSKFQAVLNQFALKHLRSAYDRLLAGSGLLRKSLQLLFLLFNARPREAVCRWKEAVHRETGQGARTKGQLLNNSLKNSAFTRIRPIYRQLVEKPSLYISAIRTLMRVASTKPRSYLRIWRLGSKVPSLSDNMGKLRLARAGELTLILKKRPAAVLRLWQDRTRSTPSADKRKSALRTILKAWGKQVHAVLRAWESCVERENKQSESRIKGEKLRYLMQPVAIKRAKTGSRGLFSPLQLPNSHIFSLISGLSKPLQRVFVSLRRSSAAKGQPDKRCIQLAVSALQRNHNSVCSQVFLYWRKDQKRLAKRFSQRLGLLISSRKAVTLQAVSALGPLCRYSARLQAAQKLLSLSRRTDVYLLRPPLRIWGDIAGERTKSMRLKVVLGFIYNTSISYQSGFWRWELIRDHGEVLFPQQLSFLKNVAKVLHRVERSRISTSFTLISCSRSANPAQTRSVSPFSLHHHSTSGSRRSSTSVNTEENEYVNAGTIHTIVNNKLTAGEIRVVRQMGAMETLGLLLRTVFVRNKVAAFVSIRDEAELNEMKECNDLLMGDMANLQEGNKQIMEAFKESTYNLEALSRKLDVMRTERVIKVLDKVRTVLPAYEAFLMIKLHAGLPLL